MRTTLDFTPYRRSLIGFDHLFDLMESASRFEQADAYPPYDVEQQDDDTYRIRLAVAGYRPEEIDVTSHQNVLVVTGRKKEQPEGRNYLYRGIAAGGFERRFQLADYVFVKDARLNDGLLEIDLKRELPEEVKPRKIEINRSEAQQKRLTKATQEKGAPEKVA
jgi:molecular chaperone IbpA